MTRFGQCALVRLSRPERLTYLKRISRVLANTIAAVIDNRVLDTAAQAGRSRNTPTCAS